MDGGLHQLSRAHVIAQDRLRDHHILRRRHLDVAVLPLHNANGNADALHQARIVCPEKAVRLRPAVRLDQDLLAKPLRGLHLPERLARRCRGDRTVLGGNLDRILLRHGDDARALCAYNADQLLDRLAADKRPCRIVDENDIRLLRYDGKTVADRILPLRTALDHTPRGKPLDTAEQPLHCRHLIGTDRDNQLTDRRNL